MTFSSNIVNILEVTYFPIDTKGEFMELNELPKCPVETTLALIGEKWRILIIRDLLNGTKRFGELKKACSGISQKVLTHNLRKMEDDGLVKREVFSEDRKSVV